MIRFLTDCNPGPIVRRRYILARNSRYREEGREKEGEEKEGGEKEGGEKTEGKKNKRGRSEFTRTQTIRPSSWTVLNRILLSVGFLRAPLTYHPLTPVSIPAPPTAPASSCSCLCSSTYICIHCTYPLP